MYFKVSDLILREFVDVAGKNDNNSGHIETMALMVGRLSSTETIVTKLIYPDQSAGPYEVRSEGKNHNFDIHKLMSFSTLILLIC